MRKVDQIPSAQILFVGDSRTGRSSLINAFTQNYLYFCDEVIPSTPRTSWITEVDEKKISLSIWDDKLKNVYLRNIPHNFACVFIILYSIDNPDSLKNVTKIWAPEVKLLAPDAQIMLVGTKTDVRESSATEYILELKGQKTVTFEEGQKVAEEIGAFWYLESSTKDRGGVEKIFQLAARKALEQLETKAISSVKYPIKKWDVKAEVKEKKKIYNKSENTETKKRCLIM